MISYDDVITNPHESRLFSLKYFKNIGLHKLQKAVFHLKLISTFDLIQFVLNDVCGIRKKASIQSFHKKAKPHRFPPSETTNSHTSWFGSLAVNGFSWSMERCLIVLPRQLLKKMHWQALLYVHQRRLIKAFSSLFSSVLQIRDRIHIQTYQEEENRNK